MVNDVIKANHDPPHAGHPGVENTLGCLKQKYYWYGMRQDVTSFVRRCEACSSNKREERKIRSPMQKYHAGLPMERLHLDTLGPFPKSERGNQYILVIMDQLSKWVEAYPVPDQEAEIIASTMLSEFISCIGVPSAIHTDQGLNFQSDLIERLWQLLEDAKTRTTPYHPSSKGLVERLNRVVLQMMRCYVNENQQN